MCTYTIYIYIFTKNTTRRAICFVVPTINIHKILYYIYIIFLILSDKLFKTKEIFIMFTNLTFKNFKNTYLYIAERIIYK